MTRGRPNNGKTGKVVTFRLHMDLINDLRTIENRNRFVEITLTKEMSRRRTKGMTLMMSGFMMALAAGLLSIFL